MEEDKSKNQVKQPKDSTKEDQDKEKNPGFSKVLINLVGGIILIIIGILLMGRLFKKYQDWPVALGVGSLIIGGYSIAAGFRYLKQTKFWVAPDIGKTIGRNKRFFWENAFATIVGFSLIAISILIILHIALGYSTPQKDDILSVIGFTLGSFVGGTLFLFFTFKGIFRISYTCKKCSSDITHLERICIKCRSEFKVDDYLDMLKEDLNKPSRYRIFDKIATVSELDDLGAASPELLAEASKSIFWKVFVAKKKGNKKTLADIASNDKKAEVRVLAVEAIKDQLLLAEIAKNDKSFLVRGIAVSKLEDQALLEKIAKNDKSAYVRTKASEKLKNK